MIASKHYTKYCCSGFVTYCCSGFVIPNSGNMKLKGIEILLEFVLKLSNCCSGFVIPNLNNMKLTGF